MEYYVTLFIELALWPGNFFPFGFAASRVTTLKRVDSSTHSSSWVERTYLLRNISLLENLQNHLIGTLGFSHSQSLGDKKKQLLSGEHIFLSYKVS